MPINTRQTNLLVQQDWTKVYQTFRDADFQSYDFETLRKSMIDYLRLYYPEDFNDFTESSEYIALIDLIAFMGQSLAFRADMNARENFIDTAERRDSIMKLAKLVSYNPKRNSPAHGFLKIDSISTSENVFDSDGINLSNLSIFWNDSANDNWYEQFVTILNATLINSQIVGKPGNSKNINGIRTDEYAMSLLATAQAVFPFSASVEGINMRFEATNMSSVDKDYLYELPPKPNGRFNLLYRTDNLGNGSNNTGFFLYFKQGQLRNQDFSITESLPNRTVQVATDNINNTDTWLYTLDSSNSPDQQWTQITGTGTNVIYNKTTATRDLFQVNTKLNDQVELVFGDGSFSTIPSGKFRFFHRVSNGLSYKITPSELQNINISVSYVSRSGRAETLTIKCSLKYTVNNATAKETIEEIRTKAPQQYYTQNRMVTGEDYNVFPYTNFTNVVKAKAVNRSSSGISRYLDVLDVSGKYSSTNVFANDGILYRDRSDSSFRIGFQSTREMSVFITNKLNPLLNDRSMMHLYFENAPRVSMLGHYWAWESTDSGYTSGYIMNNQLVYQTPGASGSNGMQYVRVGSLIKFRAPSGYYFDSNNRVTPGVPSVDRDRLTIYASVVQVQNQRVTLSVPIWSTPSTRPELVTIVPVLKTQWTAAFIASILAEITANRSFGITYIASTMTWAIIPSSKLSVADFDVTSQGSSSDSSWYLLMTYSNVDRNYTVTC